MAYTLSDALHTLRGVGPIALSAFILERVRRYLHTWAALRMLARTGTLWDAVDFVVPPTNNRSSLVYAMQKRGEIVELLQFLEKHKPAAILEIGTASGGTLFLLARIAAPDALLISIDLPGGAFGAGYNLWRVPLYRSFAHRRQRIRLFRADSHETSVLHAVTQTLGSRSLDFLFIDGDHTYGGVQQDYEMYGPLVGTGGFIAFHDICPAPQEPKVEVSRFWSLLKDTNPYREYIEKDGAPGCGIGVLQVTTTSRSRHQVLGSNAPTGY